MIVIFVDKSLDRIRNFFAAKNRFQFALALFLPPNIWDSRKRSKRHNRHQGEQRYEGVPLFTFNLIMSTL
jgi:hypothetical protein